MFFRIGQVIGKRNDKPREPHDSGDQAPQLPATPEQLIAELETQGITDAGVLEQIRQIDRAQFLPAQWRSAAYENRALPIASGQTISQPLIVALMTQALQLTGQERILEVGTGSGYQTAILARLARQVITIERRANLSGAARQVLEQIHPGEILYYTGDGTLGLPEHAPYDGILVTAAAPQVPPAYWEQLKLHGRLIIPVGSAESQRLMRYTKTREGWAEEVLCSCRFVKLIGHEGWTELEFEDDAE